MLLLLSLTHYLVPAGKGKQRHSQGLYPLNYFLRHEGITGICAAKSHVSRINSNNNNNKNDDNKSNNDNGRNSNNNDNSIMKEANQCYFT